MLLLSAALLAVGIVLPTLVLADAPVAIKVQYIRFKDEYCFTPLVSWARVGRDDLALSCIAGILASGHFVTFSIFRVIARISTTSLRFLCSTALKQPRL